MPSKTRPSMRIRSPLVWASTRTLPKLFSKMSKPAGRGRQADVDVRAGGLRRGLAPHHEGAAAGGALKTLAHCRLLRRLLHVVLEQRRALAAQDDVEAVGAAVELDEGADVLERDQAADLLLARRDAEDRAAPDQRVALEVHLRDQALHPAVAGDRVVDVRRPPVVDAVAPGIGAGLDGAVGVVAVLVGQHPAAAAEVGVEGADVLVLLVPVAAAGVALPDLDQRVLHRPAELVLDVAVDDDALADRQAVLGVVQDQVVVLRPELVGAEHRRGHFGQRLLQRDQRQARAAQHAGLVLRRVGRRVRRRVAHQEFGVGGGLGRHGVQRMRGRGSGGDRGVRRGAAGAAYGALRRPWRAGARKRRTGRRPA